MDFILSPCLSSSTQQSVCKNNSPLRRLQWMMCFAHTVKRHLMVRVWLELSNSASSWSLCWIPPTALKPWNLLAPAGLQLLKDGVITYGKHTSSAYTHKDSTSRAEPFGNSSLLCLQASCDDDVVLYRLGLHNQIYVSTRFARKFPLLFFSTKHATAMLRPFNCILSFLLNKHFGWTIFGDVI